jgi:EAL domain-containing protein (putative c-di-GMP-specific phosphodiesterase class I)/DNA-binding NarL/FixJ family response regulator
VSARARIRVLVAEDDPSVRDALAALIEDEQALELAGAAADATAAVELADRERPDVALLDVRMPGGGANAARGIKRHSPETRILALSAHDDRTTVLGMLEAGVVGYLVKGSSVESIVDSIECAAAGQGSLSVEVTGDVIEELVGQLTLRRKAADRKRFRVERIRRALSEDGAFKAVFQPICTLAGETVGAEALTRFRGPPNRGPERWFAEAGEAGLRRELELAAARVALRELPTLPPHVYLSVNVSPDTLSADGFRDLLREENLRRIVVEVTEHAPIEDYTCLNGSFKRLRDDGVRLAIDDAGAGFASLRHILRLTPDFIKLDRTLIAGISYDSSQQALAAGLISFAGKMGATIVAEGIERMDEVQTLSRLGVEFGQGYFFAKPAPLPLPGTPARVPAA